VLNHPSHERDLGKHYSNICNDAFNYCLNYCINNKLQCDYVGLVDADVVLEPTFFEKLITEFELKPLLGTISGSMYFESENGLIFEDIRDDLLIGSARLWRKKCFDDIGGFPISYSADSVSDVLAKLNGWGIYRMKDAIAIQARKMSTAEGNWKGQKINGKSAYFRNYHPLFVLFITIKKSFQHPYYIGLAFIIGYLESYFRHEGKIENDSIRNYYYCEKPKESLTYYYKKLFNFKGDKN
jgi:GT2 family glycosyltransferase